MTAHHPEAAPHHLVIVSGAGRSGTSTVAGTLKLLGYHVPLPEVSANRSNPRGHFEPRWAVDFHKRLIAKADGTALDARPSALEHMRAAADTPRAHDELRTWFAQQVPFGNLVVKDPRTFWFRDLWLDVADEFGLQTSFLTMVRHPAEVVGSRDAYYLNQKTPAQRAAGEIANLAGWVNSTLVNEYTSRGHRRIFLGYSELLEDWRSAMGHVAKVLDLPYDGIADPTHIGPEHHPVDDFVDADLRRVRLTWDDLTVPDWLKEIAEGTWKLISGETGDFSSADLQRDLDALRSRYDRLYADSIALARDEIRSEQRRARRETRRTVNAEWQEKLQEARATVAPAPLPPPAPPRLGERASAATGSALRAARRLQRRVRGTSPEPPKKRS
ncbi:MAG TPA: hypothetical protein VFL99_05480 [Segeticoccus sp.]|uniref:sulfotransferase family protein n=1 Tax=Segeticoccus sp. TaxID=2706531 RepID=UPI002D7FA21C|nr:hypothetical protein [Segeticoccus sp.]HET8599756.1 hypothetical protein [Segeticoccus sp.]